MAVTSFAKGILDLKFFLYQSAGSLVLVSIQSVSYTMLAVLSLLDFNVI